MRQAGLLTHGADILLFMPFPASDISLSDKTAFPIPVIPTDHSAIPFLSGFSLPIGFALPVYSDEFAQASHLFPFSPEPCAPQHLLSPLPSHNF